MRVIVVHDEQGNLKGLLTSPPDSPLLNMVTKPGQLMTEVEVTEDTINLAYPLNQDSLIDVLKNYQVDVSTAKARLTRKISLSSDCAE